MMSFNAHSPCEIVGSSMMSALRLALSHRMHALLAESFSPRQQHARSHAQVTFLGVSKDLEACAVMAAAQRAATSGAEYTCLQDAHFLPFTVSTQPFEQLSYAVLEWLQQRQQDCDVVQVGLVPAACCVL